MKKIVRYLTLALALLLTVTVVSCKKDEPAVFDGTASDFIKLLNIPQDRTEVGSDFTVPSTLTQADVTVDLKWTSKNTAALNFEESESNGEKVITAKLTKQDEVVVAEFSASLTYKEETATKDFKIKVSRIVRPEEALEVFYATEKGSTVTVTGYIAKLGYYSSYGDFNAYIADSTGLGGYYSFQTKASKEDFDKLKVGTPVEISGTKDVYNGSHQVKSGTLKILEGEEKTFAAYNLTNELIINDAQTILLNTARLVTLEGMKVTKVNQYDQNASSQTIVELERGGVKSGIATNRYIFEDGSKNEALVALGAKCAELEVGDYVNITGYLTPYYENLNLSVFSADDVVVVDAPEITDAEKVGATLTEALENIPALVDVESSVELPTAGTTYTDVTLQYELNVAEGVTAFTLEDNVLTVTPTELEQEATIVVTGTLGNITLEREVTIVAQYMSAHKKYLLAENNDPLTNIKGVVTLCNVVHNDDNTDDGYAIIQDADGAYYLRVTEIDGTLWESKFQVGYEVTIPEAKKSSNAGLHQVASFTVESVVVGEQKALPGVVDITEMIKNAEDLEAYQSMLVKLVGTVKSVDGISAVLTVGDKEFAYRYDYKLSEAPSVTLEVGKSYTISGVLAWFNNPQLAPVGVNAITELPTKEEAAPTTEASFAFGNATIPGGANFIGIKEAEATLNEYFPSIPEGVTLSYKKNSSGYGISLQADTSKGGMRLYGATDGNGNELIITSTTNKIAYVVINYDTTYSGGNLIVNGLVLDSTAAQDVEFNAISFGQGTNEVSIKVQVNKQVRITSIQVWFAE